MNKHLKNLPLFGVCLLLLYACDNNKSLPDPLEAGWKGEAVCEVVQDDASLRVLKCTFPPGVGHERHYHKKHFGYTLAGSTFRIKDTTGTREVDIPTGLSFSNDGVEWHEVQNIGDSTSVFLIIEPK
jgi:quercetin dioxygenase-like cupin family protein